MNKARAVLLITLFVAITAFIVVVSYASRSNTITFSNCGSITYNTAR